MRILCKTKKNRFFPKSYLKIICTSNWKKLRSTFFVNSFKDDDLYILGLIDVAEDAVARNLNLKLDELAVDGEFTPPAVIHAILLLIGNLYANREPVSYSSVNKVPYTFDYLISLYKNYKEV